MSNRDSREVSDCSVVWWQCVCCHVGDYDGESLLNCYPGRVEEGFINEYVPSSSKLQTNYKSYANDYFTF